MLTSKQARFGAIVVLGTLALMFGTMIVGAFIDEAYKTGMSPFELLFGGLLVIGGMVVVWKTLPHRPGCPKCSRSMSVPRIYGEKLVSYCRGCGHVEKWPLRHNT